MVNNFKDMSMKHFVIECMLYKRIKELGHKGNCEFDTEGLGIFDAVDWDSGLVYEVLPREPSPFSRQAKLNKYLKYGGIRDVIFVNAYTFSKRASFAHWYDKIKELVV